MKTLEIDLFKIIFYLTALALYAKGLVSGYVIFLFFLFSISVVVKRKR